MHEYIFELNVLIIQYWKDVDSILIVFYMFAYDFWAFTKYLTQVYNQLKYKYNAICNIEITVIKALIFSTIDVNFLYIFIRFVNKFYLYNKKSVFF